MKPALSIAFSSLTTALSMLFVAMALVGTTLTDQGALWAAEEAEKAEKRQFGFFRANDGDGDKKLTLEEFTNGMVARLSNARSTRVERNIEARFKKADADGDGMTDGKKPMNFEEFSAAFNRRAERRAKTKATERAQKRFQELDTNGDSFLEMDEMKAGRKPK